MSNSRLANTIGELPDQTLASTFVLIADDLRGEKLRQHAPTPHEREQLRKNLITYFDEIAKRIRLGSNNPDLGGLVDRVGSINTAGGMAVAIRGFSLTRN